MNAYIERTCTEVGDEKKVSLEDYRGSNAYVLLGSPGSGKTRSFQEEARRTEGGLYVEAHDFVELSRTNEWRDKTLFIDGLDELRASSPSAEPLGPIRARLDELGKPRFRLSCRDADWSDTLDPDDLTKVSRDGHITTLKLPPLSDSDFRKFLAALNVEEIDAFVDRAHEDGNAALLRNPLSLEHLVRAEENGQRPQSRKGAFEASCRSLLNERNPRHVRGRANVPFGLNEQLDAAASLCAIALLAGKRGYADAHVEPDAHWIGIEDAPGNRNLLESVLRTRLFESDAGRFTPLHHHIAEFLAGRHLATRVAEGLPIARATALMTGFDGGVVAALRGMWAWFAAHCAVARTVLYGDVKQFGTDEKRRLLDGIYHRSEELADLPIDHWHSPRWADLATENAADLVWDIFSKASESEQGQRVALLLTDATERRTFPDLRRLLLFAIRDERLRDATRGTALRSLISKFRGVRTLDDDLDSLLSEIRAGQLADRDDELTGSLLCELYPRRWSLADAKGLFHSPKDPGLMGSYRRFWRTVVQCKAVESERAEAERLAAEFSRLTDEAFLEH